MWIVNWISSSWLIILKKTSLSELYHIIKKWQLLIQIRWIGKKPVGQSNIFLVGLSNVHKCLLVIVLCHSVFLVWLWEGEWIVGLWPHYWIKPLMGISMVIFRRLASVKKKKKQINEGMHYKSMSYYSSVARRFLHFCLVPWSHSCIQNNHSEA